MISIIVKIKLVVSLKCCLILASYLANQTADANKANSIQSWPNIWAKNSNLAQRQHRNYWDTEKEEHESNGQQNNGELSSLIPIESSHQIVDNANELRQRANNNNERLRHLTDSLILMQSQNVRGEGK